ncbi:hypothetical protein ASPZODRAFT_139846 [Penicilliopsis zonata CBS 506.65]|uniref:Uncharacterized protein n=1 Tax=Penicilliopsis zonata CBS 506.65 TaxID=1073090 RepID=A0A1L9SNR3_9EURO|nr:hypothetical protein ASPZODRAFT_139846 [Penicilliopsis zonata CBS 506.65]OJJ48892.1 hypothetical protein ASPZODRAFT_139846 [Penicilliopsis zonata CBS 506.65]
MNDPFTVAVTLVTLTTITSLSGRILLYALLTSLTLKFLHNQLQKWNLIVDKRIQARATQLTEHRRADIQLALSLLHVREPDTDQMEEMRCSALGSGQKSLVEIAEWIRDYFTQSQDHDGNQPRNQTPRVVSSASISTAESGAASIFSFRQDYAEEDTMEHGDVIKDEQIKAHMNTTSDTTEAIMDGAKFKVGGDTPMVAVAA